MFELSPFVYTKKPKVTFSLYKLKLSLHPLNLRKTFQLPPSLRDLLEAHNVVSCIERPPDTLNLQMKRPLDKSSLEKGPPAKIMRIQTGPQTTQRGEIYTPFFCQFCTTVKPV
jgi:hypothetical protein